jgi:hypothetical protein
MTRIGVVYAIFLVVKRIYTSATMELVDGSTNAMMSIASQSIDSFLLLVTHPYNDSQVTTTEAIAGVMTAATYFAIGLPAIYGPHLYPGDFVTLILAITGVVISAFMSAMETFAAIISTVQGCIATLMVCFPAVQAGAGAGAGADVLSETVAVVSEHAQGAAEEALEGEAEEEGEGEGEEELLVASSVALAVGMAGVSARMRRQGAGPGAEEENPGGITPGKGMQRFRNVVAEIRAKKALSSVQSSKQGAVGDPGLLAYPSEWTRLWEDSSRAISRSIESMSIDIESAISTHPTRSKFNVPFAAKTDVGKVAKAEVKSDLVYRQQSRRASSPDEVLDKTERRPEPQDKQ